MNLFDRAPSGRVPLSQLKPGDSLDGYYRVAEVTRRKTATGNDFLILELMDASGRLSAKVWNGVDEYAKLLQAGRPYRFRGDVVEYKGRRDVKVQHIRAVTASDSDFDESALNEPSRVDAAALLGRMAGLLDQHIHEPHLKRLAELFLAERGPEFSRHFGAQKIHHAYGGGLLEHTASVLQLAVTVADQYELDKEVLLIGALFHDIGKLEEFRIDPVPDLTKAGGLLGHIVIGHARFIEFRNRIDGFPEELSLRIQHLLVSHHGEKEFGSPEVPRTPEAMALHVLDLLDSRLNIFREARRTAEPGRIFSDYQGALGTRILLENTEPTP
jgi:3'-5' exoribonuclease